VRKLDGSGEQETLLKTFSTPRRQNTTASRRSSSLNELARWDRASSGPRGRAGRLRSGKKVVAAADMYDNASTTSPPRP
jgi:hypothetical protein